MNIITDIINREKWSYDGKYRMIPEGYSHNESLSNIENALRDYYRVETCDVCNKKFVKLPDHPKRHSFARCPHCMAEGLDAILFNKVKDADPKEVLSDNRRSADEISDILHHDGPKAPLSNDSSAQRIAEQRDGYKIAAEIAQEGLYTAKQYIAELKATRYATVEAIRNERDELKAHIAELEKKITDLESLTIVQENLPVPALRRRIAELESQLLARNPEIIKVGSLEVASKDLKGRYNLYEALEACAELGDGWRLPTKDELNELYKNKDTIGGFVGDCYWSSTEYADHIAWFQRFDDGAMLIGFKCYAGDSVRPVRDSTI